jgi:hypothetical protein
VALQRPFKSAIRRSFEQWAAQMLHEQIRAGQVAGFAESFKMASIKPKVLQWCIDSWEQLQLRKSIIAEGWYKCCISLYDVHDEAKRVAALKEVAKHQLDAAFVPEDEEEANDSDAEESEHESDQEKDELDTALPVTHGTRRSTRERSQPQASSYMLNSQYIVMTEDSES